MSIKSKAFAAAAALALVGGVGAAGSHVRECRHSVLWLQLHRGL